jgi:hypothetical protein
MIPYEELDERYVDGFLLDGPACQCCFQAYRAAKKASVNSTAAITDTKISEVAHRGPLGLLPPPSFSSTDRGLYAPPVTLINSSSSCAGDLAIPPGFSACDRGKHAPLAALAGCTLSSTGKLAIPPGFSAIDRKKARPYSRRHQPFNHSRW